MREIKYRAWDKDNNCMINNWYEITEEKFAKGRFLGRQKQTLATEVMQYTGLKDKNGKEIYEGDIVTSHFLQRNVEIHFEKGKFLPQPVMASENEFEVLGNIYKNPELLKEKADK